MIDGLCKNDIVDLALLYLPKMATNARHPTIIAYTTLINGFCNSRRAKDGLDLWHVMEQKGCHPNSCIYNFDSRTSQV